MPKSQQEHSYAGKLTNILLQNPLQISLLHHVLYVKGEIVYKFSIIRHDFKFKSCLWNKFLANVSGPIYWLYAYLTCNTYYLLHVFAMSWNLLKSLFYFILISSLAYTYIYIVTGHSTASNKSIPKNTLFSEHSYPRNF